jgi:hypothetical protein
MFKNVLLGMGLFGLSIASAKSYSVTLSEPYTVGTTQLAPGDYRVVVNGSSAVLEDSRGQTEAGGAIENEARKFHDTALLSHSENGTARLEGIELGGTQIQVDFK